MSANVDLIKGRVILVARATAKAGKADEVKALLLTIRDSAVSDKEPNVYTFRLNQFGDEFVVFEEYENADAVKQHMSLPHFQAFAAKNDELIASSTILFYNEL